MSRCACPMKQPSHSSIHKVASVFFFFFTIPSNPTQDIPPKFERLLRESGNAAVLPRMYRAVLPMLIPVDDACGLRLKSLAIVNNDEGYPGQGNFEHLTEPVGQSSGAMLAYTGPIREIGSIVEVSVELKSW